jgi:ADP-ribose pyrophosphatase YjhB (NUDIX family)
VTAGAAEGELPRFSRVAAYALCVDERDRLLLCRLSAITNRPGAWTLPGGGIDFGEHPEAAAIRELHEETGLEGRITELLAVGSWVRDLPDPGDAPPGRYHSVQILYRAEITGGALRPEAPGGSSDGAEWFDLDSVDALELSGVARSALAHLDSRRSS